MIDVSVLAVYSGLEFTCIALSQNVAKKSEELADSFLCMCVFILRPVDPKARLPKGIGRPAACLAYLYYVKIGPTRAGVDAVLHVVARRLGQIPAHCIKCEPVADSFSGAHGLTLKPHHSFLIKPIFSAAMGACPERKDFYTKLGSDVNKIMEQLRTYLAALDKIVAIIKAFLDSKDAQWQ
jgi:hypothetical protein